MEVAKSAALMVVSLSSVKVAVSGTPHEPPASRMPSWILRVHMERIEDLLCYVEEIRVGSWVELPSRDVRAVNGGRGQRVRKRCREDGVGDVSVKTEGTMVESEMFGRRKEQVDGRRVWWLESLKKLLDWWEMDDGKSIKVGSYCDGWVVVVVVDSGKWQWQWQF